METNRFESQCWECNNRITTKDGGASWKHDARPKDRHSAHPHGVMRQI